MEDRPQKRCMKEGAEPADQGVDGVDVVAPRRALRATSGIEREVGPEQVPAYRAGQAGPERSPCDTQRQHGPSTPCDVSRIAREMRVGEECRNRGCESVRHRYTALMKVHSPSQRPIRNRALAALRGAFTRQNPNVALDENGYAGDFRDTLLPLVSPKDFEADMDAGDGNELQTKFRAVHSSSGLAVNCFARFRRSISELTLPGAEAFETLAFEQKCPTGLRGGTAPNLDLLLTGPGGVVGVESKLTEYLTPHRAVFSPAYAEQIRDERREQGYFREMLRLMDAPDAYVWLDAAQLIKHAFGLARTHGSRPVTLLYLFWEPANPEASPEFAAHRKEIATFAERVAGATPEFRALSYPELWRAWQDAESAEWLDNHIARLRARYEVTP